MNKPVSPSSLVVDQPAEVVIEGPELVGDGFRRLERFSVTLDYDGTPTTMSRDILRIGRTVGIVAIDLSRDEIVLIRQFRLPAHFLTGRGDNMEIPAGYIDGDEPPLEAARRECIEEIGVAPKAIREVFSFLPAPGMLEEQATIFVASVDASAVPETAGAASEIEHTRPLRVSIDEALAALGTGQILNGYLIISLQWLALNRARLPELLGDS
ncbi:ADP-ribose pyrophosphatase [Rhodovulum sp. PH10]|uniref:NUDIX domain-containing protein n=1 Tax=Rhodovulum sp. PH10 TaxID=1187851 RepID=UPI00027C2B91|nr:NUDIX hydrolase [Rhodovulum sp. PH10]EJW11190.1 ADP-ribose pyrophosphatase [Rhodovulum sp. PH10]